MSRRQKLKKYLRWSMRKHGCVEREFLWKSGLLRKRQINKLFPLASLTIDLYRDAYVLDERDILNVFKQKYSRFDDSYYRPIITSELLELHAERMRIAAELPDMEVITQSEYERRMKNKT